MLIHIVLRHRGVAKRLVPPISLVLATWATADIAGLTSFRHIGPSAGTKRSRGAEAWLVTFAAAVNRSAGPPRSRSRRSWMIRSCDGPGGAEWDGGDAIVEFRDT
jgi:hypothetical protein